MELSTKSRSDKKIKIVFISPFSSMYGGELALLEIAKGLNRKMFAPTVISGGEGPLLDNLRKHQIPIKVIKMPYLTQYGIQAFQFVLGFIPAVIKLATLIRENEFDVIYNNILQNPYGATAARLAGIPCLWHVHEMGKNPILQFGITRFAGWLATQLIVVSAAVSKIFPSRVQYKIHVVYNGVDPDYYDPQQFSQASIREDLSIHPGQPVIGFVGRLHPSKRPFDLLYAFHHLHKQWPDGVLLFSGEGPNKRALQEESTRLSLQENVRFLGYVEDVRPIYSAIDVLVLSSGHEAQGRAIVEAMAMQKPVVATAVGGIPETVGDKAGLLVPVGEPEELSSDIDQILSNPARAKAMGRSGRERVLERFNLKHSVAQIESILLSMYAKA